MPVDEFGAIERLLKKGQRTARLSTVWKRIHEETGAGVIRKDQLLFTPIDLQRLREYGKYVSRGVDPLSDSLAGSRMEVAGKTPNEKFASDSVFGDLLVLATAGETQLVINGQPIKTPRGSVLSIGPGTLDRETLKQSRVVIIENGSIMPYWQDIRLPPEWQDSVLLYRGHRENMQHVRAIIDGQPAENLALYYDFDPEGLEMALGTGKGTVLIPTDWGRLIEDEDLRKKISQRDAHRRQSRAMTRLKALAKGTDWEPVVVAMGEAELAVMQEHLTVRGWMLAGKFW